MAKEKMKEELKEAQGGKCEISQEPLPKEPKHYDTDRIVPKAEGGTYRDLGNVRVLQATVHMERHGTLPERSPELDSLKDLFDMRAQTMKFRNKINNQILACERRTDNLPEDEISFLKEQLVPVDARLKQRGKEIEKTVKEIAKQDAFVAAALQVKSIGHITIGACLIYLDLSKARHASSLWKYTGLHAASHERYQKGEASGGNKTLRTILYTMADSQMKGRGPYRDVYDNVRARLSQSEKVVKTCIKKKHWEERPWKDVPPSHQHGAALRAVMKHFLADYWYVGRQALGLDVTPIYAEAKLEGNHRTIMPQERGWPVDVKGQLL